MSIIGNLDFSFLDNLFTSNSDTDVKAKNFNNVVLPIYDIPSVFRESLSNEVYQYLIYKGGRGSTKTHSVLRFLIEESFRRKYRGTTFLFLREYQKNVGESLKPELEAIIEDGLLSNGYPLSKYFNIQNQSITNKLTNVKFTFSGARDLKGNDIRSKKSNANKLKGLSRISKVFVDEADMLTEHTLQTLVPTPRQLIVLYLNGHQPTQVDKEQYKDAQFIFCLNPTFAEDPVVAFFKDNKRAYMLHINIFDLEEKYKNKSLLELAKEQESHPSYNHVWLGMPATEMQNSLFSISDFMIENKVDIASLEEIVIAVDPAITNNKNSDETGIVVVGKKGDVAYVLKDLSGRYNPDEWAKMVVKQYYHYKKHYPHIRLSVVAEVNQGGELVSTVIKHQDKEKKNVRIIKVRASKGKETRIEPVSMLYKDKKIKHIEKFGKLQYQLLLFYSDGYMGEGSPDRADALAWGVTQLMLTKKPEVYVI